MRARTLVFAGAAALAVYALMKEPAQHGDTHAQVVPELTEEEANSAISRVKMEWRAQDGESAEQILMQVSKVAHFMPRDCWATRNSDGTISVSVTWVKHKADEDDDAYTISWTINNDGSIGIDQGYAKTMELGWQAFAISTIQNEVMDEEPGANTRFLHDIRNLNFVRTRTGPLGDLLAKGGCNLRDGDPVGVDYTDTWGRENKVHGDFWRLQLSVDCRISGPRYFTHDGVILFKKMGADPWKPYSFFANRIANNQPGSWFRLSDPIENAFFAKISEAGHGAGWNAENIAAAGKAAELMNDGSMVRW